MKLTFSGNASLIETNDKNLKKIWEHRFQTSVEFDWNDSYYMNITYITYTTLYSFLNLEMLYIYTHTHIDR